MPVNRLHIVFAVLAVLTMTGGCAPKNQVALVGPQVEARAPTCSLDVVVLDFTDASPDPGVLGVDREGKAFTTDDDVGRWASWSLFEALSGRGCHARHRTRLLPGETAPVVTGQVKTLNLEQTGFFTYVLDIAVTFHLQAADAPEPMWTHTVTVNLERSDLPDDANPQSMLSDGMAEVLADAVPRIMARVGAQAGAGSE